MFLERVAALDGGERGLVHREFGILIGHFCKKLLFWIDFALVVMVLWVQNVVIVWMFRVVSKFGYKWGGEVGCFEALSFPRNSMHSQGNGGMTRVLKRATLQGRG